MKLMFTDKKSDILNKYIKIDKKKLDQADNILYGKLKLLPNLETINISKKIDWYYKHEVSYSTYQLYLHTLNYTNILVAKYLEVKDEKYILCAHKIILDWLETNLNHRLEKKLNYGWYDHPTASRIQNILYFQVNAPEQYRLDDALIGKVIDEHLKFLIDLKNYPHNNHGIMMDKSILLVSLFLKDYEEHSTYINFAKSRIEKAILRDYSYESTHLENSPDYHRMVTNWLLRVSDILTDLESPLSKQYRERLEKASKYNSLIINYNKEYPMIGDTSYGKAKVNKLDNNFVDYEAGVAVINRKYNKSTLVFNCGFQNKTHKHHDDLSFCLTLNKEKIFVDSGKYNYSKNDPIRQHMLSPMAHTTIYIRNKEYNLNSSQGMKITEMYETSLYSVIKGVHELYEGISIERTLVYLGDGAIILIDDIKSEQPNIFVQNFVLNHDIQVEKIDSRAFTLVTPMGYEYILQEHSKKGSSRVLKGLEQKAMISEAFNSVKDTTRIEILKKTINTRFITTLSDKKKQIESVKEVNNELIVTTVKKKHIILL